MGCGKPIAHAVRDGDDSACVCALDVDVSNRGDSKEKESVRAGCGDWRRPLFSLFCVTGIGAKNEKIALWKRFRFSEIFRSHAAYAPRVAPLTSRASPRTVQRVRVGRDVRNPTHTPHPHIPPVLRFDFFFLFCPPTSKSGCPDYALSINRGRFQFLLPARPGPIPGPK